MTSPNDARLLASTRIPAPLPTIPAHACFGGDSAPQHRRAKREAREPQTATTLKVLTPVNSGHGGFLADTLEHSRETRTVRQCPPLLRPLPRGGPWRPFEIATAANLTGEAVESL